MHPSQYIFADFLVDVREETLYKAGEPLKFQIRTFQVLSLLLENSGNIVKKEEFFEKVWQGAFVEDNNLTVAIAQIRKILGETADQKFIETVPRKGYRFLVEVERIYEEAKVETTEKPLSPISENTPNTLTANPAKAAKKGFFAAFAGRKFWVLAAVLLFVFSIGALWKQNRIRKHSEPLRSIAVLPFAIEKTSPDSEIFAEKLTQNLIYNLGRVTDARVSAYDAVALFNAPLADLTTIKSDLQVEGAIIGKIQNVGESANLKIEIKDLRDDEIIFTKDYSLKTQDLAESQYRIAHDVALEIGKNKESEKTPATTNYEAQQAYLSARHSFRKRTAKDYEQAIERFTNAVLKDAAFADAYAGLASAHVQHGLALYANRGLSASRKSFPAAKEFALKALDLKKDSDEALAALAFVNYRYEYDWKNAEENFKKAVEINPNNGQTRSWFGDFLHHLGRFDEGFAQQNYALQLEPNSARILSEIAWGNYLAHRFDAAADYAQKSNYIDKTHAATLYNLSEIYEQKGNLAESVALWKEAMVIEAAARRWIANIEQKYQTNGRRGFAEAKAEWLENLIGKDYVYPTDLAKCYAVLGNNDKAVEWLEKGIEAKVPDILSVKYAPAFDSLKNDARFQKILEKMNFPK